MVSAYCQLVNNVLHHSTDQYDPPQLDLVLREVNFTHGDEIARLVKTLYQADPSKDHVKVYKAVCTELLSEFTVPRLCMSLYYATKYLDLIEELEQPSKAELADLRLRFADALKLIIKGHHANPKRVRWWVPWLMGVTAGLIGIGIFHQIKSVL